MDKDIDDDLLREYYLDIVNASKNGFGLPLLGVRNDDSIRQVAIYAAVNDWSYSDFRKRLCLTSWLLERQESQEMFLSANS